MTNGEPGPSGAAGGPSGAAPPPSAQAPKVELRDGVPFMEIDGKMVKVVKESDLIAAKQSLESKLETQQTAHTQAIDAAQLELSAERQKVADLNAELTKAKEAQGQGATSDEEVARIRQELTEAQSKVETLTADAAKSLELRRALLVLQYPGVSADSLADKDMKALDSLEEALKAVATSRGSSPGQYAVGGGIGGGAPQSDLERAKEVISATPVLGVREPAPEQK